jgi:hypothetical protein
MVSASCFFSFFSGPVFLESRSYTEKIFYRTKVSSIYIICLNFIILINVGKNCKFASNIVGDVSTSISSICENRKQRSPRVIFPQQKKSWPAIDIYHLRGTRSHINQKVREGYKRIEFLCPPPAESPVSPAFDGLLGLGGVADLGLSLAGEFFYFLF